MPPLPYVGLHSSDAYAGIMIIYQITRCFGPTRVSQYGMMISVALSRRPDQLPLHRNRGAYTLLILNTFTRLNLLSRRFGDKH